MIGKYFVLLVTIGVAAAIQPIPVTIYYDSLCPDSMRFFTQQFTPTWKDLKAYISPLTLVPYGKSLHSTSTPIVSFSCERGPNECFGNKYQSCVFDPTFHFTQEDQVNYINCLMTKASRDVTYNITAKWCEKSVPMVKTALLESCAQGARGNALLLKNGQWTNALEKPLSFTPRITLNNRPNAMKSTIAEKSFRSTLCELITDNPKPKACDVSGAPITTVGLITLLTTTLVARLL